MIRLTREIGTTQFKLRIQCRECGSSTFELDLRPPTGKPICAHCVIETARRLAEIHAWQFFDVLPPTANSIVALLIKGNACIDHTAAQPYRWIRCKQCTDKQTTI